MRSHIGMLFGTLLLPLTTASAQPTGGRDRLPDKAVVGSVATDANCERVFEPTSPASLLRDLTGDVVGAQLKPWLDALSGRRPDAAAPDPKAHLRQILRTRARATVWLPIEIEEKIGDHMASSMSFITASEVAESPVLLRVSDIFDRLIKALPPDNAYKFRLRFAESESANMTALPGGIVVVNTGMLPRKIDDFNDNKYVALLAHEIAHVTKRHQTREMQGYIADTMTVAELVRGLQGGKSQLEKAVNIFSGIATLDQLFSRFYADQELEADACIPRLVKAAGFDPQPPAFAFRDWALAQFMPKPETPAPAAAGLPKSVSSDLRAAAPAGRPAKPTPRSEQGGLVSGRAATGPTQPVPGATAAGGLNDPNARALFENRHPPTEERIKILAASLQFWAVRDPTMRTAGDGSVRLTGSTAGPEDISETPAAGGQAAAGSNTAGGLLRSLTSGRDRLADKIRKLQGPQDGNAEPAPPGQTGN